MVPIQVKAARQVYQDVTQVNVRFSIFFLSLEFWLFVLIEV